MVAPQQPEQRTSGVPILFIRCPKCWQHPVTFTGERPGTIELSCQHCGNAWNRADRRAGGERRHISADPARERREAQRRGRRLDAPPQSSVADADRAGMVAASLEPRVPGWSLEIRGDVSVDEDLVIEWHVRGTVSAPGHTLVVGTSGNVVATLTATNVVIRGTALGNITAASRITIEPGARVKGDLISADLRLEDGAEFTGRVERVKPGQ